METNAAAKAKNKVLNHKNGQLRYNLTDLYQMDVLDYKASLWRSV